MFDWLNTPDMYLVRHGSTEANAGNLFRGWNDYPLDAEGLQSADEIANYFSYVRVGQVVSSDLTRAMQTAEMIPSPNIVDRNCMIRPWNIGDFAGQPRSNENMRKLKAHVDNPDMQISNGESLNEFRKRWEQTLHDYLVRSNKDYPIVIVTHTSNIVAAHHILIPDKELLPEHEDIVEPGGIVAIRMGRNGGWEFEPVLGAVEQEKGPKAS
jgi:glucosyl-3-phosphoglycerate phosphatase